MRWSDFQPFVAAEVQGVPAPVIDQYSRLIAIDFCEKTQLNVVDLDPIDVVAGTAEYDLYPPSSDDVISQVMLAWYNNAPLKFIPAAQLRRTGTYWPNDTGVVQGYTQLVPASLVLYPNPTTSLAAGLNLMVSLKPSLTSSALDDWIANKYFFDLANGIKGRLMGMPGQTWTSKDGAAYYEGLYIGARDEAAKVVGRNVQKARPTE